MVSDELLFCYSRYYSFIVNSCSCRARCNFCWFVLKALDLPVERDSISSGSGSGSNPGYPHAHLHRMYFSSRTGSRDGSGPYSKEMSLKEKEILDFHGEEPYSSYVQFARDRPHDYSYPVVQPDPKKYSPSELSNSTSLGGGYSSSFEKSSGSKKPLQLDPLSLQPPPLLPTKSTGSTKKKRFVKNLIAIKYNRWNKKVPLSSFTSYLRSLELLIDICIYEVSRIG